MQRLVLTCLCALALTAPAQAQDPQVDPDSPAGTEYQLPIDRAREQAGDGSRRSGGAAAAEAPLFGEGVDGPSSRSRERHGSGGSARTPTTTVREQPKLGTSAPEAVQTQAQAPEGGNGLVAIGVGAVGVLLIGGLGGWAWRRRTRAS
jgi:cobalamin biosynthesis Mg chelatase CobN